MSTKTALQYLGGFLLGGVMFISITTFAAPTMRRGVPPSISTGSAKGLQATGGGECNAADAVVFDNNGAIGCPKLSDVAPQGLLIRSQPAYAAGTQTASDLTIGQGQDETKIAIDGADPTGTCAGDNDTVTVTVYDSNGTATATVLTEGTEWTAAASVATTCASLATAVDALAGVGATCTSPNVFVTLDLTTAAVGLAESEATCTTVAVGTRGVTNLCNSGGCVVLDAVANTLNILDANSAGGATTWGNLYINTLAAYADGGTGKIQINAATSGGALSYSSDSIFQWSSTTGIGGTKDLGLSRSAAGVIKVTDASTGTGQYLGRLVNAVSATPAEPLACAVGTVGVMTYVDDTNDGAASYVCICMATDDTPTYDWVKIADFTTACTAF